MEAVVFMFCLTLHNIEEALWGVEWRAKTMPNSRIKPNQELFNFALIVVTVLGYLAAGLHLLYPDNTYFEYAFIGGVGVLLVNAIMPHIILTIVYRKPCPGVLTGCFLIIPFHVIILHNALNRGLTIGEALVSALAAGLVLLCFFPVLMLARKYFEAER